MTIHPGPLSPRRRKPPLVVWAILAAVGILTVAVSAVDPPGFDVPVPAEFNKIVLLAQETIDLKKEIIIVSGDVIGNGEDSEIKFDKDGSTALGYSVKADSIDLKSNVGTDSSFFCNDLSDGTGTVTCTPLTLPVFSPLQLPPFLAASSNSNDVDVPKDQSVTLAEGFYGDLDAKKNTTIVLTGGTYDFGEFKVDEGAQVLFQAPTILKLDGKIDAKKFVYFGPDASAASPPTAADIRVYVDAQDASFDMDSEVHANLYLSDGKVDFKKDIDFTGSVIATEIVADQGSTFTLDTAFRNLNPIAVDDGISVLEGGSAATLVGGGTSLLDNDSDPNGDGLSINTAPVSGSGPINGTVVVAADGTFVYTHNGSETTVDSFDYEVCDDGVAPGPLCSQATVAIAITPVNDPPVAVTDVFTVDEGGTATVLDNLDTSLLDNDTDAENDGLTATVVVAQATANGTVDIAGDGTFSYTHNGSETVSDSFTYEVCDDGSPSECDTGTVDVTVNPVNDNPVADPQTVITEFPITIVLTGSDAEADPLIFSVIGGPTFGSVGPVTGTSATSAEVTYSPPTDPEDADEPVDTFTFQVDDGNGGTGSALVTINLIPPNSPPVTGADTIRTTQGGTTTTTLLGATSLLANDFDPDSGTLTIDPLTPVSGPTNGTVTLNANGTFSYQHANNGTSTDAFVYRVCDNGSPIACSNGQVTVQVFSASIMIDLTVVGSGTVTSSPAGLNCSADCTATVSSPDRIVLSATAATNFAFTGFSGDADCSDGELIPNGNKVCTATFTAVTPPPPGFFNLTVSKAGTGGGTVVSDPAGIDCGSTCTGVAFPAFQRIELLPIPDAGSEFVNWNGTTDCLDGALIRLPNEDASCVAVFDAIVVPPSVETLTVQVNGTGAVRVDPSGLVCGSLCTIEVATDAVVTLTARGVQFWSGDPQCVGTSSRLTITMSEDTTCIANF